MSDERRHLDTYRPLFAFQAVALDPGDGLEERVTRRLHSMMEGGLLAEVAGLAGELGRTAGQAVGYKELLPVVKGELAMGDGVAAARRATLGLAKRQRTYFRRDPRLHWLPWSDDVEEMFQSAVIALRS